MAQGSSWTSTRCLLASRRWPPSNTRNFPSPRLATWRVPRAFHDQPAAIFSTLVMLASRWYAGSTASWLLWIHSSFGGASLISGAGLRGGLLMLSLLSRRAWSSAVVRAGLRRRRPRVCGAVRVAVLIVEGSDRAGRSNRRGWIAQ